MKHNPQTDQLSNTPEPPMTNANNSPDINNLKQTPASPLKRYLKIVGVIALTFLIVSAAYVAYYITLFVGGIQTSLSSCSRDRDRLFSQTQSIENEFNRLMLVSGQTGSKAQVTQIRGDCVDSLPMLMSSKEYTVQTTAGSAFDNASKSLEENGYTAEKDDYPTLNPCSFEDKRYYFTKQDIRIGINLTCASYGAAGDDWKQVPVTHLRAYLIATTH